MRPRIEESSEQRTTVGQVALLTGCGNSFGQAIAAELARAGFRLALFDRDPQRVAAIASAQEQGVEVLALPSDSEELAAKRTVEAFGRLDCLVNLFVPEPGMPLEELHQRPMKLLATCLDAAELMSRTGARGVIVNHCFLPSTFTGTPLELVMPAIKGAMTGITRALCRKFGNQGITVNCIQTGLMEMPEVRAMESERLRELKAPVGRRGTPEDMARLTTFLATTNRYWTGQAILLDGGLTSGLTST